MNTQKDKKEQLEPKIVDKKEYCTEYAKQLSQIKQGDKIIVAYGTMNLEKLCKNTQDTYELYKWFLFKKEDFQFIDDIINRFQNLLTDVREDESIKGYTGHISETRLTVSKGMLTRS